MLDVALLKQLVEDMIPFNRWLGVKAERIERGHVTLSIAWREELIGDPIRQALHGGVISALADTAGGLCIWTALENPMTERLSTVDLRIDYLRPGRHETLIAHASLLRLGAKLAWSDIKLFHPSAETELIATARGVYAIKSPKRDATRPLDA